VLHELFSYKHIKGIVIRQKMTESKKTRKRENRRVNERTGKKPQPSKLKTTASGDSGCVRTRYEKMFLQVMSRNVKVVTVTDLQSCKATKTDLQNRHEPLYY